MTEINIMETQLLLFPDYLSTSDQGYKVEFALYSEVALRAIPNAYCCNSILLLFF